MRYFAYGSNMLVERLRRRVGEVDVHGRAVLFGHQLRFHKVSEDGSGKCDIHATGVEHDLVHGVVFEIEEVQKVELDRFEGLGRGYEEVEVSVELAGPGMVRAFAYRATICDARLRPYEWYHALVLAGAREHGLPVDYVSGIEQIGAIPDPDPERARRQLDILGRRV